MVLGAGLVLCCGFGCRPSFILSHISPDNTRKGLLIVKVTIAVWVGAGKIEFNAKYNGTKLIGNLICTYTHIVLYIWKFLCLMNIISRINKVRVKLVFSCSLIDMCSRKFQKIYKLSIQLSPRLSPFEFDIFHLCKRYMANELAWICETWFAL